MSTLSTLSVGALALRTPIMQTSLAPTLAPVPSPSLSSSMRITQQTLLRGVYHQQFFVIPELLNCLDTFGNISHRFLENLRTYVEPAAIM